MAADEVEAQEVAVPRPLLARSAQAGEPWSALPDATGALAHAVFLSRYSRRLDDGRKERWVDVCRRVTEGTFSVLRTHCCARGRPWDVEHGSQLASEFFTGLFELRFTPAGRGLRSMGTVMLDASPAALNNCAFLSTRRLRHSAARLMDAAMLGVGVGFDVAGAGALLTAPARGSAQPWTILDDRAGWVQSVDRLLACYLDAARDIAFDYSRIRRSGTPLRTSGGISGGPEPLRTLHERLRRLLAGRAGERVTTADVVDLMNLIGVCVSSGNLGRAAELALGPWSEEFMGLKDPRAYPDRNHPVSGWSWMSNNTVAVEGGPHDYAEIVARMGVNGEPGLFWPGVARGFGRIADGRTELDRRIAGLNPCGEQPLEDNELCALVETFPTRHRTLPDFLSTLRMAMLYGKAVTLLTTGWQESDAVIERNRRIGCSVTGVAQFADSRGWRVLERWLDAGYRCLEECDRCLASWLDVPMSIKRTTVKPSGTVSALAGVTSGVHWPVGEHALRRISFTDAHLAETLAEAGHTLRRVSRTGAGSTDVVEFPVQYPGCRPDSQVALHEKLGGALLCQRAWADNGVSVTVTFDPHSQSEELRRAIESAHGRLKSLSALPYAPAHYEQLPHTPLTARTFWDRTEALRCVDWESVYCSADECASECECGLETGMA